MSGHETGEGG